MGSLIRWMDLGKRRVNIGYRVFFKMETICLMDEIYTYELIRRKTNYLRRRLHVEFFEGKVKIGFFTLSRKRTKIVN